MRPSPGKVAVLAAIIVAVGGATGSTLSAFSDTTANGQSSFAAADSFCAGTSTQTVGAAADTTVSEAQPNQAAGGSAGDMSVTSSAGTNDARALVRFTLPTRPLGCSLTGATLRLFSGNAVNGRNLLAQRATAAWSESTVTWNTQPGIAMAAGYPTAISGAGWREWDVKGYVDAQYAGTNHGFVVRDEDEGGNAGSDVTQKFFTKDHGTQSAHPELVLTFG